MNAVSQRGNVTLSGLFPASVRPACLAACMRVAASLAFGARVLMKQYAAMMCEMCARPSAPRSNGGVILPALEIPRRQRRLCAILTGAARSGYARAREAPAARPALCKQYKGQADTREAVVLIGAAFYVSRTHVQ